MLRDGVTGDWIGTFIGHKGAVWQARLSSDATVAATGAADFSAVVWNTYTGEILHKLDHSHIVRAIAFPPQAHPQLLATGGQEKKLRIFDLSQAVTNGITNASEPSPLDNVASSSAPSYEIGAGIHQGTIKSIVWGQDPNIIVTAADDKKIRWWDIRTQSTIGEYALDGLIGSCELNGETLDGQGAGVLSIAAGKSLYFFDGDRPSSLLKQIKTNYEVASVALCGSQRKFVTGQTSDTWVRVWDFDQEKEIGEAFVPQLMDMKSSLTLCLRGWKGPSRPSVERRILTRWQIIRDRQ